jgi:hypothetical protein
VFLRRDRRFSPTDERKARETEPEGPRVRRGAAHVRVNHVSTVLCTRAARGIQRPMPAVLRIAILLAAIAAGAAAPDGSAPRTPERPVEVRSRTASGTTFSGTVTSWDRDALSGSFGERRWLELPPAEIRRVFLQLMDKSAAPDWLMLGELLASAEGAARQADDAFAQARRKGATAADVDAARGRAARAAAARRERERMDGERRLQDEALPDGATAEPWPVLTDAERAKAAEAMREEAAAVLATAGIAGRTVETERFVLAGDLPQADLERFAAQLDRMYSRVAGMLAVPEGVNLFWGKAVILCFERQETFRMVEAAAFNHHAPPSLRGICHMRGPKVTISIYRGTDEQEFASTLVHETLHGLMHRYATPVRLPDWANEGFAEWVARECVPGSRVDAVRRPPGLRYLRQGGDAARVLSMDSADGSWPGPDAVGYAVGYLLVDLMIADRPSRFGAWAKAVKGGKPWRQALAEDFGVDADRLAASASQWFKVNDGAPRQPSVR